MLEKPAGTPQRPAKVLVVDDHPVVREGLAAQVALQHDLEVCGEAEDLADALALFEKAAPDVVIVDISLKTGNGIDLIKRLRARDANVRIVVWSMYPESLYAERALRAGAMGYIHKGKATREIVEAVRTVLAGRVYLDEELAAKLLGRVVGGSGRPIERSPIECLSDRELEAFKLMGHGLTTEQIAGNMHVSPKTVETYRARIKEKLGLSNITALIHRAAQWVLENDGPPVP
jgi:DNA-binding NarL/FixJ family response regulator